MLLDGWSGVLLHEIDPGDLLSITEFHPWPCSRFSFKSVRVARIDPAAALRDGLTAPSSIALVAEYEEPAALRGGTEAGHEQQVAAGSTETIPPPGMRFVGIEDDSDPSDQLDHEPIRETWDWQTAEEPPPPGTPIEFAAASYSRHNRAVVPLMEKNPSDLTRRPTANNVALIDLRNRVSGLRPRVDHLGVELHLVLVDGVAILVRWEVEDVGMSSDSLIARSPPGRARRLLPCGALPSTGPRGRHRSGSGGGRRTVSVAE